MSGEGGERSVLQSGPDGGRGLPPWVTRGLVALAVVALLVAVGRGIVTNGSGDSGADQSPLAATHRGGPTGDVSVRDPAFREAVRAEAERIAARAVSAALVAEGEARVLHAADDGSLRLAVVSVQLKEAGQDLLQKGANVVLLTGNSGAAARELKKISGRFPTLEPGLVLAQEPPANQARLLFLGPPGVSQVEYSPRPHFRPDGTWTRSWRTLPVNEGVVLAKVSDYCGPVGLVRYERAGKTHVAPISTLGDRGFDAGPLPTDIEGLRSGRLQQHGALAQAVGLLSDRTCIKTGRFDLQVLWHGRGANWILGAELPHGATFQVVKARSIEALRLVPPDRATSPFVAAGKPPANEVFAFAPEARGGSVQLRRNDQTVAAARLDDEGHAIIQGSVAERAQGHTFTYRILDRHGRKVKRGTVLRGPVVWGHFDPAWNVAPQQGGTPAA